MNSWTAAPGEMPYDDARFGDDDRIPTRCHRCGHGLTIHRDDVIPGGPRYAVCVDCGARRDARSRLGHPALGERSTGLCTSAEAGNGWPHESRTAAVEFRDSGGASRNSARPHVNEKPSPSHDPETVIEDAQRAHRVLR